MCDAAVYNAHDIVFWVLGFTHMACEVPRTTLSVVLAFYMPYVQSYRLGRLSETVSCLVFLFS